MVKTAEKRAAGHSGSKGRGPYGPWRAVGAARFTVVCLAAVIASCAFAGDLAWGGTGIEEASWSGVRALSVSALEDAVGFSPGCSLEDGGLDDLLKRVVDVYRAEGYLNASAGVPGRHDPEGGLVYIEVDEGRRFSVGDVTFKGLSFFEPEELMEKCRGLERGAPFTRQGLEGAFDAILRAYGEEGYAECRVSPISFAPDSAAGVDFTLQVSEGRRCLIERVSISGGKTTSNTVARTAGIEQGGPFDPWRLEEVRERLSSSGLFSDVESPVVKRGSADSLVVIEVPVREPPSSSVSGLLGYSGREGGAVGFIDLELGNIMGTGREGSFRWENSGGGLSSYSAGYREPWLGGLPASLELRIDHLAQDTTYSTTGFAVDLKVHTGRMLSFALGLGREKTALSESSEGSVTRRTRLALRGGIELDARDNAVNPRTGALLSVGGDWGSRQDGGPGLTEDRSWRVAHIDLRTEFHQRTHGRHGLFVGAQWRSVLTDEEALPWDQLLRFGGASSLRGYREDQFRAEETGLVQLEHRIALGSGGSRIFVFTDLGLLGGEGAPGGLLIGYGLGIRAATVGGLVGIDFGLGKGDSWSEGKVHVRMKRLF